MKVEIDDWMMQRHTISSLSPRLIGDWFAEHAERFMSADARVGDCRLRIWPQTREEADMIGHPDTIWFTQDDLLHLAQRILDASQRLADRESAA